MEISYENKIRHLNWSREQRMNELKAYTVALWIDREVKYGFVSSEEEVIQEIEDTFLKWLVDNERYEDAIWLRDQLRAARETFSKPKSNIR